MTGSRSKRRATAATSAGIDSAKALTGVRTDILDEEPIADRAAGQCLPAGLSPGVGDGLARALAQRGVDDSRCRASSAKATTLFIDRTMRSRLHSSVAALALTAAAAQSSSGLTAASSDARCARSSSRPNGARAWLRSGTRPESSSRLSPPHLQVLLFRFPPLRQVARDLGVPEEGPRAIAQRRNHDARPESAAVLANAPALPLVTTVGARQQLALGLAGLPILWRVEEREVPADNLRGGVALDAFGARIPRRYVPLRNRGRRWRSPQSTPQELGARRRREPRC